MAKNQTYVVDTILDHKMGPKKALLYFVSWQGYATSQNTWEPVSNLDGCQDLVKEYHLKAKNSINIGNRSLKKVAQKGTLKMTKSPKNEVKPKEKTTAVTQEEEFEIEAIINHKKVGRGFKFLVRWEGFEVSDDTWEPESALATAPLLLQEYRKLHEDAFAPKGVAKKVKSPKKSPKKRKALNKAVEKVPTSPRAVVSPKSVKNSPVKAASPAKIIKELADS